MMDLHQAIEKGCTITLDINANNLIATIWNRPDKDGGQSEIDKRVFDRAEDIERTLRQLQLMIDCLELGIRP